MQLDMTKGRPLPVILQFTLPLIIGNIFQQLYNMVDTIIVGRYVGADALAAVGSTGTIMFLLTGFSQGITAGFAILISQRYGAHDADGVKQAVANGTLLSVLFTLFLTCSCLFLMKPLLTIMNTPDNIFADAYSYIMIITAGIVANIFYNLLSAFLRAVGNSKVPLFFLVFSACLNVLLDLFFIIQLHMGVAGAAWATNLAQAISAVLCAIYIWCKIPELKPYRSDWKISRTDTKNQLAAGIPMALQFAITSSGTMIMQSAINLFGSTAVAAFTATGKLQSLLMQGMIAMGQTMATYSGQNFGSGDIKRIKAGVKTALGIALVYALVVTALMCSLLKPALHLLCIHVLHVLHPAEHDFHFPKHYAGMRLRLSSDDGRRSGASCKTGRFHLCHENPEFPSGLLWRSGSLDCSCCIYRYFLPLCYAKNRTISSCLNNIIPHPLPYNSRMPMAFLNFLMSISLFYHSFNKNSVSFAGIIYQNMGYRSNDFSILQNRSSAQPRDNPTGFPNQIRICHLKTNALI